MRLPGGALRWRRDCVLGTVPAVSPRWSRVGLAAAAISLVAACTAPPRASAVTSSPAASTASERAVLEHPEATVGPLFANGTAVAHGCTASVLDSPGHNLILTAAHCVS